jgi:hypothetical protein
MKKNQWIILGLVAVGASILIWKRDKIFNKSDKKDEGTSSAQGGSSTPCPEIWRGYVCQGKWKRNKNNVCYCDGDLIPQEWVKKTLSNK